MYLAPSPSMAALASAFHIPVRATQFTISLACSKTLARSKANRCVSAANQTVPFSSTSPQLARKKVQPKKDRRVILIRYFLKHPGTLTPRPLRFSRTRTLRHWTIHRAWQLHTRNIKQSRLESLQLQYHAMRDACEELRVGAGDGGRLFRKAMTKTGVFGANAVPMEYTKGMMDYVGTVDGLGNPARIWDSDWKR